MSRTIPAMASIGEAAKTIITTHCRTLSNTFKTDIKPLPIFDIIFLKDIAFKLTGFGRSGSFTSEMLRETIDSDT